MEKKKSKANVKEKVFFFWENEHEPKKWQRMKDLNK